MFKEGLTVRWLDAATGLAWIGTVGLALWDAAGGGLPVVGRGSIILATAAGVLTLILIVRSDAMRIMTAIAADRADRKVAEATAREREQVAARAGQEPPAS